MTQTIALLGTGTMGAGMARNIIAAGHDVRVWNRSAERAAPLADAGATVAGTVGEAVAGAGVVVTMLWDADAVEETLALAGDALAPGTLWLQTTTVGVEGAERLGRVAAERGLVYVDAPVLGTKQPAENGALVVLASGPDDAREAAAPVFDAIGSRTLWVGPAGHGSRLKLVANAWVLVAIEGIAECLTLAGALGLDPALFLEAVRGGAVDAPYVGLKGRAMIEGSFDPAFSVAGAAKDAGLILAAARDAGADVAVVAAARDHLDRAVRDGHGDLDMAATYLSHTSG